MLAVALMSAAAVLAVAAIAGTTRSFALLLARPLVAVDPVERVDAVVVVGYGTHPDGTLTPDTAYGLLHGIRLVRRGVSGVLILSGGSHRGTPAADSDVMAEVARSLGVPSETLVLERSPSGMAEHAVPLRPSRPAGGSPRWRW